MISVKLVSAIRTVAIVNEVLSPGEPFFVDSAVVETECRTVKRKLVLYSNYKTEL